MGIGIGILIATVVMSGVKLASNVNDAEIERRAKGLGMDYPSEFRVIEEGNK